MTSLRNIKVMWLEYNEQGILDDVKNTVAGCSVS